MFDGQTGPLFPVHTVDPARAVVQSTSSDTSPDVAPCSPEVVRLHVFLIAVFRDSGSSAYGVMIPEDVVPGTHSLGTYLQALGSREDPDPHVECHTEAKRFVGRRDRCLPRCYDQLY